MTIIRMWFSCLNRELNLILFPHQNCLRMGGGVNGYERLLQISQQAERFAN